MMITSRSTNRHRATPVTLSASRVPSNHERMSRNVRTADDRLQNRLQLECGPGSASSGMRCHALALAFAASLLGCESKKSTTDQPAGTPGSGSAAQPTARAPLTDLTTASTLAPVRAAFNAKKGEARFLTLLSPT